MSADEGAGSVDRLVGDAEVVREVFEEMPVYLLGYEGPDHVVVAVNSRFRSLLGRAGFVGLALREAMPQLTGQAIYEIFDRVYATGETQVAQEWRLQISHEPGREPSETFVDFSISRVPGADGRPDRILAYGIDVTERVRERQAAQRRASEAERRFEAARDVVVELQEALLPSFLPILPTADLAAHYLVAAQDQAAGGDWFDGIPLPGGILALVVGDVVGHGVKASAAMGQLRAVLGELLVETGDVDEALARADRMASRVPALRAATLCVALLDPASGSLRYATCGHPPPLVIGPQGETRYLDATGGGPLGTSSEAAVRMASLRPDDMLLLFSDGLVERPGRPLHSGTELLAQVAGDAAVNRALPAGAPASVVERVCQQTVELLTRTGYADDVTVLGVRLRGARVEPLRRERPADVGTVAELCTALGDWLRALDAEARDVRALQLAVSELLANAVEHAYPSDRPGTVHMHAVLGDDGVVQLEIVDDGTWRAQSAPAATSGRGLWMASAVVDDLRVQRGHPGRAAADRGTAVTVRHQLRRHTGLVAGPATAPVEGVSSGVEFAVDLHEITPRVLRIRGRLDLATSAEFADRLEVASRGGVHSVTVDLTDVEVLASAAVRILFAARDQHARHGTTLTLVASPASLPGEILTLVGLDHVTEKVVGP